MGCCILGAIVIGRCLEAFERVQRFLAPVHWLLRMVMPPALRRGKPFLAAVVIEAAVLISVGWAHSDHIVALLQYAGHEIAGADIPAALCVGGGVPEVTAGAQPTPQL